MRPTTLSVLLALLARASASSENATAARLAAHDAQYAAAELDNKGNSGFGIKLESSAILAVDYGFGEVGNGHTYTVSDVSLAPTIRVLPSAATLSDYTSSTRYTLTLADASSLTVPDPEGNYRHFLSENLLGSSLLHSEVAGNDSGTVVTYYASPGPNPDTGAHRYAWLLFRQPGDYEPPKNLSKKGTASGYWYVSDYVEETGVKLVAATYFVVDSANSTASTSRAVSSATSAINTATKGMGSSDTLANKTATASATSSAKAQATSSTSSASPSATSNAAGAGRAAVSVGGALAGVMGLAMLL